MEKSDFTRAHCYGQSDFERILTKHSNIVGPMIEHAEKQSDAPFITAVSSDGEQTVLTYGLLETLSRRQAAWLVTELGIRDGDVVAFLPFNDIASVVAIFALLRAGASIFFVNPLEPRKRLDELLSTFAVSRVLCATKRVTEHVSEARLLPDPDRLPTPAELPEPQAGGSRPAFFFATSGSTAASKIVAQAHYNVTVNAEALRVHHHLEPGVTMLGCLPIHHVNGLHFTVLATFWAGSHAVLMESFSPMLYWTCLQRYRPRFASVVPSLLEVLLCAPDTSTFPREFRYFVSAAAPLSAATCRAVLDRFGVRVNQGYGLTETTNFSTTMPTDLSDAAYRRLMVDTEIPSIGTALFGNSMAVLRADGSYAECGEQGEICMRGHNVMLGYQGNPASTGEAFEGGWFHSGDLGYALLDAESGQGFYVITGRKKNIAKVMGVAVSLEEMERTLKKHPDVIDAACFSMPDELLGEAIVAAVVSTPSLHARNLQDHLLEYFAHAVLPNKYLNVGTIPRTTTGKILRGQLPELLAASSLH